MYSMQQEIIKKINLLLPEIQGFPSLVPLNNNDKHHGRPIENFNKQYDAFMQILELENHLLNSQI